MGAQTITLGCRLNFAESEAMLKTAEKQVEVARSAAATILTRIDDATAHELQAGDADLALGLVPWGAANRRVLAREAARTALVRGRVLMTSR